MAACGNSPILTVDGMAEDRRGYVGSISLRRMRSIATAPPNVALQLTAALRKRRLRRRILLGASAAELER